MKIGYKFRWYPTLPQQRQLAKEFGCARVAYNWLLDAKRNAYKASKLPGSKTKPLNAKAGGHAWTAHRADPEFAWLRDCSSVPQQQAQRHLNTAYDRFFKKISKYPQHKQKHDKQAVEYTKIAFKYNKEAHALTISKIGHLRIKWSRQFTSAPSTVTITKDRAGRYYVSLRLDEAKPQLPKTGRKVGIDLGLLRLATLSNGELVDNPRHFMKRAKQLRRLQRCLSRRQGSKKGETKSNRWLVQKQKVACLYGKISDSRKDYLDKLTTRLVKEFDILCMEDLNVAGMLRNHRLAKHIACASFGEFKRQLVYKAKMHDKLVLLADRWFASSKTCSCCGHLHDKMPLAIRNFKCEKCGVEHDRDINAAKNLENLLDLWVKDQAAAGQAVFGRGGLVRLDKATTLTSGVPGSVNQPSTTNA